MTRKLCVALCALALPALAARAARAEVLTVAISFTRAEQRTIANRVAWELLSEGYAVEWPEPEEPFGCELARRGPLLPGQPRAWVRLQADAARADHVVALACYRSATGAVYETSSAGPVVQTRKLALATTEALNGLRAKVLTPARRPPEGAAHPQRQLGRPTRTSELPARAELVPDTRFAARLGPAIAADVGGTEPLVGASGAVELALLQPLSLTLQGFFSLTDAEMRAPDRTLFARVAWVSVGPLLSARFGPLLLAASVRGGLASVRVRADAQRPRLGSSDSATLAIVSLGSALSYPASGPLFGYAGVSASELLPRVRFALGAKKAAELGQFLLDGSLGVGLRWR